jgi:hypothetical protein
MRTAYSAHNVHLNLMLLPVTVETLNIDVYKRVIRNTQVALNLREKISEEGSHHKLKLFKKK